MNPVKKIEKAYNDMLKPFREDLIDAIKYVDEKDEPIFMEEIFDTHFESEVHLHRCKYPIQPVGTGMPDPDSPCKKFNILHNEYYSFRGLRYDISFTDSEGVIQVVQLAFCGCFEKSSQKIDHAIGLVIDNLDLKGYEALIY